MSGGLSLNKLGLTSLEIPLGLFIHKRSRMNEFLNCAALGLAVSGGLLCLEYTDYYTGREKFAWYLLAGSLFSLATVLVLT